MFFRRGTASAIAFLNDEHGRSGISGCQSLGGLNKIKQRIVQFCPQFRPEIVIFLTLLSLQQTLFQPSEAKNDG